MNDEKNSKMLPEIAQEAIVNMVKILVDDNSSESDLEYAQLCGEASLTYLFEAAKEKLKIPPPEGIHYFFGNFMQKQAFRNNYVQIIAEDIEQARRAMFDHFGCEFMTVDSEENFSKWQPKYKPVLFCVIRIEKEKYDCGLPVYTLLYPNKSSENGDYRIIELFGNAE